MFRRLSERGEDQRDIRRPTRAGEIASICEVPVEKVVAVVDVFRAPGVSFLMPAWPEPIAATSVLDISHESLIRQWDRLKDWARDEGQSAETYRFLEQTARRWRDGKAALWGTPNLELALDWQARERPTAAWAERYGGDFAAALAFLEASEAARRDKEAEVRANQLRQVWRLRAAAVGMAAALVALVGGAVFYLYGWVLPHESHYNAMIKRWGKPEGYGELRADQVRRRAVSLKFVRNNGWFGEVDRVEAVDANGECTHRHSFGTYLEYAPDVPSPTRECAWEFIHGHDGQVVYEKAYNKFDELVWGFAYVPAIKAAPVRRAYFVGPDGFPQPRKNSKAEIVEFEYDPDSGNEVKITYWDRRRAPQRALDKAYGQKIEYYDNGLPRLVMSLDVDGQAMNDTIGNAYLNIIAHDEIGNVKEAIALDKNKHPVSVIYGWHKLVVNYDSFGNLVDGAVFDVEGRPTLHVQGYHRWAKEYDDRGNTIAEAYFDVYGGPAVHADGYHRFEAEYDERGNVIAAALFDTDGAPAVHTDGYHRLEAQYDDRGNKSAEAYFDVDSRPAVRTDGYHRRDTRYDDRGNALAEAYFDAHGAPAVHTDRYHRIETRYDDHGNLVASAFFDVDGRPAVHRDGYHRWTKEYDDRGDAVVEAYFDVNGGPAVHRDGYHRLETRYDDRGNAVGGELFDIDGKPAVHADGYHRVELQYDDRGNKIAEAYFDVDGRPTVHADGYHRLEAQYDDRGRMVEGAFYGASGELTPASGHAMVRRQYDAGGHLVEEAFYGPDEKLLLHPEYGYAITRNKYDEKGRRVEEAYYGPDEKLLLHPQQGYATAKLGYDSAGNMAEIAFYGAGGERMFHSEYGYATAQNEYNEAGQVAEQRFYGPDEKLLIHLQNGYAIARNAYDEGGRLVERSMYGPDEELNAVTRQKYDEAGRLIQVAWYGSDDALLQPVSEYKYDDAGNRIERSFRDASGALVASPGGYAIVRTEYAKEGTILQETYHKERGDTPIVIGLPNYDASGKLISVGYYDADDQPLVVRTAVAAVLPGSQAARAGIAAGDLVLQYHGTDVAGPETLQTAVADAAGPGRRPVLVRRGSELLSFEVGPGVLGILMEPAWQTAEDAASRDLAVGQ